MSKKADSDFLATLEKGIKDVLENKSSTAKERMEAVNAGTKLMLIKHKISDSSDDAGSFFSKGK